MVFAAALISVREKRVYLKKCSEAMMDCKSDKWMHQRFRFRKDSIRMVAPYIHATPRGSVNLTPLDQVLAFLGYTGQLCYQEAVGDILGMSRASVCRSVHDVANALLHYVPLYIRFPDTEGLARCKIMFYDRVGIPNVVGCLDCTHVEVRPSRELESEYVNRKSYYSLNVQTVSNEHGRILNIVAAHTGSVHDTFFLRHSRGRPHARREGAENRRESLECRRMQMNLEICCVVIELWCFDV